MNKFWLTPWVFASELQFKLQNASKMNWNRNYINVFNLYYLGRLWKLYSERVTAVQLCWPLDLVNGYLQAVQQFRLIKIYRLWQDVACQLESTWRNAIFYGKPVNDFSAEKWTQNEFCRESIISVNSHSPPHQKKINTTRWRLQNNNLTHWIYLTLDFLALIFMCIQI